LTIADHVASAGDCTDHFGLSLVAHLAALAEKKVRFFAADISISRLTDRW
jgi:hypothetical protein